MVGWLVATIVAWEFWQPLWKLLVLPVHRLKPVPQIVVNSPMGAVSMSFQVALVAGSVLAAPWVFLQVWVFIRPALFPSERAVVLKGLFFSTFLFVSGMVAGYFTVFPWTLQWLSTYGDGMFQQLWTVDAYTEMSVKLLGGMGAMFEFPLLTALLSHLGLVGPNQLWRWSRGAIVAIFVLAAMLTPPDPVSQCILAAPMLILYFAGVLTAKIAWRKS